VALARTRTRSSTNIGGTPAVALAAIEGQSQIGCSLLLAEL